VIGSWNGRRSGPTWGGSNRSGSKHRYHPNGVILWFRLSSLVSVVDIGYMAGVDTHEIVVRERFSTVLVEATGRSEVSTLIPEPGPPAIVPLGTFQPQRRASRRSLSVLIGV
jgi:hypothetical protein